MNFIKKSVAFACVAMLGLGLFSCKKCSTCTAKDTDGTVVGTTGEFCGKKKEVEDAEAAFKTLWSIGGYTTTCE